MLRKLRAAVVLVFCAVSLSAQQKVDGRLITWDDFVENIYDYIDTDGEELTDDYLAELKIIHDNPINLNTATRADLSLIPFLSETQIDEILDYVAKHHPMRTLGELMFIRSLSKQERELLMLFCRAGEDAPQEHERITLKKLLQYSRSEVMLRTDIPFYRKAGYDDVPDTVLAKNPNKVYKGDPMYRSLRYRISSMNHFDAGIQIEKDPGERDFDYISFYTQLTKLGQLQTLILGDYKVSFGQGLVVNTSTGFGKNMMLSSMNNLDRGLSRHSSMSESKFFRGIAGTVSLSRHLEATAFFSYRHIDGTLLSDSTPDITSIKTDGLHRTQLERSKHRNLSDCSFGGNIHLTTLHDKLRLGLTAIHTHLSRPLSPKHDTESTLYRRYNPSGTDFSAFGLSYMFIDRQIQFSGETALAGGGGIATVNSLQYRPDGYNTLTAIQRFYHERYATLYGKSFGENSSPQNESGIYLGWNSTMLRNTVINAYADFFRFPYRKYQVSDSSWGYDLMAQLTFTPNDKSKWDVRYRLKSKQKDCRFDEDDIVIAFYTTQNLRLQHTRLFNDHWSLRSSLNGIHINNPASDNSLGFALSENLKYSAETLALTFSASYFNTDDYSSRIYSYEPSMLYSFGMSSFYGKGMRLAGVATIPIIENLTANAKLGFTKYFDRDTIGTGLEQISSSCRTDLQIQLRYKF